MLNFGQHVETWQVLIGCEPGYGEPLAAYVPGARFCRYEADGQHALVFKKFAGSWIKFRFHVRDIRSVTPNPKPKPFELMPYRC